MPLQLLQLGVGQLQAGLRASTSNVVTQAMITSGQPDASAIVWSSRRMPSESFSNASIMSPPSPLARTRASPSLRDESATRSPRVTPPQMKIELRS